MQYVTKGEERTLHLLTRGNGRLAPGRLGSVTVGSTCAWRTGSVNIRVGSHHPPISRRAIRSAILDIDQHGNRDVGLVMS